MEDYLRTLRTRDGTAATSLLMDRDSERELLNQLIQQREEVWVSISAAEGQHCTVRRMHRNLVFLGNFNESSCIFPFTFT